MFNYYIFIIEEGSRGSPQNWLGLFGWLLEVRQKHFPCFNADEKVELVKNLVHE